MNINSGILYINNLLAKLNLLYLYLAFPEFSHIFPTNLGYYRASIYHSYPSNYRHNFNDRSVYSSNL